MSGKKEIFDGKTIQLTLPLSALPSRQQRGGSMRCVDAVKEALRESLKQCGMSRETVADELSRLTGERIGVNQIDNWASAEKRERRIPLEYAAALAVVLGDHAVVQAAVEAAGLLVLGAEETPLFELGKMTAEDIERRKRRQKIMERIGK